ncbi:hypothetical protein Rhopal_005459-T1 [Rhodotorula paludigena]|uniref:Gelsolin-like domain-containing protein n=1 Tax=Rhodotorula paludigena TaxID=86838 RepID=A0AAV5GR78_9BASI|nr:hypothetical protein Rhopal_005459-T1 [Rhodotorula paludigena]
MDVDPSYFPHDSPPRSPSPVLPPLPPVALPSAPRPTVSPSVSRVFQRKGQDSAPTMSGTGLDLSRPSDGPKNRDRLGSGGAADADLEQNSQTAASSPSTDSRDTASARTNILNLVAQGQQSLAGAKNGSSTPSLAMFMGGGNQRRVHRVGTGMTEDEKAETERLEQEMAATRARWGGKGAAQEGGPPQGAMSLAALMRGGKAGAPPAADVIPPAPAPAAEPRQPEASSEQAAPTSPPLVEAKVISRSPPPTTESAAPVPPPTAISPPPTVAPSTSSPPLDSAASPRLGSSSSSNAAAAAAAAAPSNTLTRLQSSHIVADRLKWSQSLAQPNPEEQAVPRQRAPSGPPSPEKRRSVIERWGRDEPNVTGGASTPPSPTVTRVRPKSWVQSPPLGGPPKDEGRKSPERTEEASIETAKVEHVDEPEEPVAPHIEPKLVHVTRDRARPTKSTPRTTGSSANPPGVSAAAAPELSTSLPAPPPAEDSAPSTAKTGYTKPAWSGAPIGVRDPSHSSPKANEDDEAVPEKRHTRGVALPGLSAAPLKPAGSRPAPICGPSAPSVPGTAASDAADDDAPASPSVSSVRAAAMRWGKASSSSSSSEAMQALKASYGVRAAPVPTRQASMPVRQQELEKVQVPTKSHSVEVPVPPPVSATTTLPVSAPSPPHEPPTAPERVTQSQAASTSFPMATPSMTSSPSPSPAQKAPTSSAREAIQTSSASATPRTLVDDIVSLVRAPRQVVHLPPGETLSLDVFHLNSPTDDPHPIDHNHMLFGSEILGIVHRDDRGRTSAWVWYGAEAGETRRTEERIERLAEKVKVELVEVGHREEPPALAEAFAGQLTICKGKRDEFDHLAPRMFTMRESDGVVFVDEEDLTVRSLCSGYCTTFSSLGEVYAWLGEGSTDLERQACCEFAEAIADGRSVSVLAEGEETALFWHQMPDGTEHASANYWRARPHYPLRATLVRLDPSASPPFSLVQTSELSQSHVYLLDGGYAEHWVIVPEQAKGKKDDIRLALDTAAKLSSQWSERGFPSRTPYHVLAFPSLIPKDLPFLSRQFDWSALNSGQHPTKMHVFTADEARETLL